MNRFDWKRLIGWVLIVLSLFIFFGTLKGKYGGGPPLPQLVPLFGIPFVALFLGAQIGLCLWLRAKIGLAWIAGEFLLGLLLGCISENAWAKKSDPHPNPAVERVLKEHGLSMRDYDWTRDKLITGVCLSGLAIGFGFVGEKL
ncbi:MAG TPA: hypothetical protein VG055_09315 [Planctomycetaceae bacterium]|jgi:hypothetical protein|nr:hypothetical protein [Planctomycetaceae bacterium]